MFPGVDGFHWTFAHVVFLAIFFLVGLTIVATTVIAVWRAHQDVKSRRVEQLRWLSEFQELPLAERTCRHELAGRVEHRTCPRAFACGTCPDYAQFAARPTQAPEYTFGMDFPPDRLYHRGHTWVREEADGLVMVGLDDLASRLVGKPGSVVLPEKGQWLEANGTGWHLEKNGCEMRVMAPIAGEVVETGSPAEGWYLKLRVPPEMRQWRHLLRGGEVPGWLMRELERLQLQLAPTGAAPSLADGGMLVDGLMDQMPNADWDKVMGGTFLEG